MTQSVIIRPDEDGNFPNIQIAGIQRVLAFSTTTPLGANAVYTSPTIDAINYKTFSSLVVSDVAGSYFQQYSDDGITWTNSSSSSTAIAANTPTAAVPNLVLRYLRFVYTNGATPQTSFRFSTYLAPL